MLQVEQLHCECYDVLQVEQLHCECNDVLQVEQLHCECYGVLQVEQLHCAARRSLAARQIIPGDYQPDDLPGGIWLHGPTLDVSSFVSCVSVSVSLI